MTVSKDRFKQLDTECRGYRRLARGMSAAFIIAASLAVTMAMERSRLIEEKTALSTAFEVRIATLQGEKADLRAEKNAMRESFAQARDVMEIALYGVNYALRSEQAKCGAFEQQRNEALDALENEFGHTANLRYQLGTMEQQLSQCRQTTSMVTDKGWTGQAEVDPED